MSQPPSPAAARRRAAAPPCASAPAGPTAADRGPCRPDRPYQVQVAGLTVIRRYLRRKRMRVFSLVGYSAAGYQDPAAMLAAAEAALRQLSPQRWLVNIGATADGIGAAYPLAKRLGFGTLGIVSSQALDPPVALSPAVDRVFAVPDALWGGRVPGSARTGRTRLSPTSAALVRCSDRVLAIGGGEVARDEWLAARRAGCPVGFVPAEMAHAVAIAKAQRQGQPVPADFRGALHLAWAALPPR